MSSSTRRADAVRNRAALLAAAHETFAEHGAAASLSMTASRAGVAIGTLYKHFPTRRALVGALLAERHEALFAEAATLGGDDLSAWVRRLGEHAATYRGVAELIAATVPTPGDGPDVDRLDADCARMTAVTHRLVDEAQAAGRLRPDVTADDLIALAGAVAWTREQRGPERAEGLLVVALDGLTASGAPAGT